MLLGAWDPAAPSLRCLLERKIECFLCFELLLIVPRRRLARNLEQTVLETFC